MSGETLRTASLQPAFASRGDFWATRPALSTGRADFPGTYP